MTFEVGSRELSVAGGRAGDAGYEPDRSGLVIVSFPIVRGKAGSSDSDDDESLARRPLYTLPRR